MTWWHHKSFLIVGLIAFVMPFLMGTSGFAGGPLSLIKKKIVVEAQALEGVEDPVEETVFLIVKLGEKNRVKPPPRPQKLNHTMVKAVVRVMPANRVMKLKTLIIQEIIHRIRTIMLN